MGSIDVDRALAQPDARVADALLALSEDQWYERKSGRIAPKDLAHPLIAFANAEGGTLVVGLHNGQVVGVPPDNENAIRQAPIDFTVPPVRTQVTRREIDGKILIIFRVDPGESIHTTRSGDCYLRIGDESRKLSLAEQRELTYDKGVQSFESTPIDLVAENLDQQQLAEYGAIIGSSSTSQTLAARDLIDRRGQLTVAAELLFDERPQRDFPSAYVRVLKYDDDDRGVGASMSLTHEVRIEGSLPTQITDAAEEIEKFVPHRQQLAKSGRFEHTPIIPRDVWLEGLVNAVVHRSYSMMGDHIRVELFPHRIEVSSPGRFPGIADPSSPLTISRYARNPRIARVCADMGITRELGEGIKRMFLEMQRLGLADPLYQQGPASVTLILSAANAVDAQLLGALSKNARQVLDLLRIESRPLSTGQVAQLVGIARPTAKRALESLVSAGLVRWEGTSDRDPRASWHLL